MYRPQDVQLEARVSMRQRVESMRAFRVVSHRVATFAATGAAVCGLIAFVCLSRHLSG